MADAAVELKCGCGHEAALNLEGSPAAIVKLTREFWRAHAGHRSPERPALGFDLSCTGGASISAVASIAFDGEDDGSDDDDED